MSYSIFLPQFIVLISAFIMMFANKIPLKRAVIINIVLLILAFIVSIFFLDSFRDLGTIDFDGFLFVDRFSIYINLVLIILTVIVLCGFVVYKDYIDYFESEVLSLLNFALLGFMLMAISAELVTLFISIEISAFSMFCLIGYSRHLERVSEAVLKYFISSSFMATFYLLGMVFIYGTLGTTKIIEISSMLEIQDHSNSMFLIIGLILILFSSFFKIGTFGFYNYGLDSYYSSDLPTTGFIASVAKFGFMIFFIRVIYFGFMDFQGIWKPVVYTMAILTMLAGNFMSFRQKI